MDALLAALIDRHARLDDADPAWPDRDRIVLGQPAESLPQGLALSVPPALALGVGVGMALAERHLTARFGRAIVDHRVYVSAEPSALACGPAHEAAMAAAAHGLGRLAVLAALPAPDPGLLARFKACGWGVRITDPADPRSLDAALSATLRAQKPVLIASERPDAAIPGGITSQRAAAARRAWLKRLRRHPAAQTFTQAQSGQFPAGWQAVIHAAAAQPPGMPAEGAARGILQKLAAAIPDAAALPGRPNAWAGLDQAAAAALLGMALHGGVVPVGWLTPDRMHHAVPALLAADEQGARLLAVVLEEGHVTWRAEALHVHAPADAAEAADLLILALRHRPSPVVIAGAMNPSPAPSGGKVSKPAAARGGYLLEDPPGRAITLLASGPRIACARQVASLLTGRGVAAAVAALPSPGLLLAGDPGWRRAVLGTAPLAALSGPRADEFQGLAGWRDLVLSPAQSGDPEASATAIMRHLQRGPAILEKFV